MPQFVANGPIIPESLITRHEEGRVIFFCGAGISYAADLPSFKKLVEDIYEELDTVMEPVERTAFENLLYDQVLNLLELRYPGNRRAVRPALLPVLKPKTRREHATSVHESLLDLAKGRDGNTRLVTTNFDRIFETLIRRKDRKKIRIPSLSAPNLPIPKWGKWNGIVYLHGLLPTHPDELALNRLVMTSGDFGLAYLVERWASRFVSELFRNFTVCFVGYSLNDPVLRYMMDALAADRQLGESTPDAYAFADAIKGDEDNKRSEWEAKGVKPLIYTFPDDTNDHSVLRETLLNWSATYSDGVLGKRMIVAQHASTPPVVPTRQDYIAGRMLWALSDESATKYFSEYEPVPPLGWLRTFEESVYGFGDLPTFDITPIGDEDDELSFSFVDRPSSYQHAPWMALLESKFLARNWDGRMESIARWLLRHLGDIELFFWVISKAPPLTGRLVASIRRRLDDIERLEQERNTDKLNEMARGSKKAIPDSLVRTLWRLAIEGRIRQKRHSHELSALARRIANAGFDATARYELKRLITPVLHVRRPIPWPEDLLTREEQGSIRIRIDGDVGLAASSPHLSLRKIKMAIVDAEQQKLILRDATTALHEAFELMAVIDKADEEYDLSYLVVPSIESEPDLVYLEGWPALLFLVRDTWVSIVNTYPDWAFTIASEWYHLEFPIFKRLAFWAASHSAVVPVAVAVDWLTDQEGRWLWSSPAEKEVLQLLGGIDSGLAPEQSHKLQRLIVRGRPRETFGDHLSTSQVDYYFENEIWARLLRLQQAGVSLIDEAATTLSKIESRHPDWTLEEDSRVAPELESLVPVVSKTVPSIVPNEDKITEWLMSYDVSRRDEYDVWKSFSSENPRTALGALQSLASEGDWRVGPWRAALYNWSTNGLIGELWPELGPVLKQVPKKIFGQLAEAIAYCLDSLGSTMTDHFDLFVELAGRVLRETKVRKGSSDDYDPLNAAINSPIGQVTQALLSVSFKSMSDSNRSIPGPVLELFTSISDDRTLRLRLGRVILASRLVPLHSHNKSWVEEHLIPMFDWENSPTDAQYAWMGFMRSPRLYLPVLLLLRTHLFETAKHYDKLNDSGRRYVQFLTFFALDHGSDFSLGEFREAFSCLPPGGLEDMLSTLAKALKSSDVSRLEYWKNRVQPVLALFPKQASLITAGVSERFANLCVVSEEAFPEVLNLVRNMLGGAGYVYYVLDTLESSSICKRFPSPALEFLDAIVTSKSQWEKDTVKACLSQIEEVEPGLAKDLRYRRIEELVE